MKVTRSAFYGDEEGLGLTKGLGVGVVVGIGAGVGVAVKRISAGVAPGSTMSMMLRASAAVPVCALAVLFVLGAAFIPVCVTPVGSPLEPPTPAAALVVLV